MTVGNTFKLPKHSASGEMSMIMKMFKKEKQSDFSPRKLEQNPSFYMWAIRGQHNQQLIRV